MRRIDGLRERFVVGGGWGFGDVEDVDVEGWEGDEVVADGCLQVQNSEGVEVCHHVRTEGF